MVGFNRPLCYGQSFSHQASFVCDNNFLLLNGDDGYYTSGLFLRYDRQRNTVDSPSRPVYSFEAGQMIYNAHSRKILPANYGSAFPSGIDEIDRPIAGYLFAKASRTTFLSGTTMIRLGVSVGVVGESSGGRRVQETWHRWIGVKDHWNWVWDYQVKNDVGANMNAIIAVALLKNNPSVFQITPVTQATLGTQLTNLSQGLLLQLGKLRAMRLSSYWYGGVCADKSGTFRSEFYLFYQPQIMYQLYNATIQGGMFRDDKGPVVTSVRPWVMTHTTGVRLSLHRFDLGYHVTFQTREAKTQRHNQSYASITSSVRF